MTSIMKRLIVPFIILLNSIKIFSYPIDPVPLRKLVMTSEFIIIGYVRTYSEDENNFYFQEKATIEIKEVLQGDLVDKIIVLDIDLNTICPAPASYYDSTYTLAFFNKDKKGQLYTNSLSYGSKTLSLTEIEIYKSRIIELQNILTIQDSINREEQIVKWLIKCAEDPVTRWEGAYELSPVYVPLRYDKYLFIPPTFQISETQKQFLKGILFSVDTVTFTDLRLIDIFLLSDSAEIKDWMMDKLRNKRYNRDFTASELSDRVYFVSNTRKKEIKRPKR